MLICSMAHWIIEKEYQFQFEGKPYLFTLHPKEQSAFCQNTIKKLNTHSGRLSKSEEVQMMACEMRE